MTRKGFLIKTSLLIQYSKWHGSQKLSGFSSETHFVIVKLESKFLQSCTKSDRNQTDIHSIHFQLISFQNYIFIQTFQRLKRIFYILQHIFAIFTFVIKERNIASAKMQEENSQ